MHAETDSESNLANSSRSRRLRRAFVTFCLSSWVAFVGVVLSENWSHPVGDDASVPVQLARAAAFLTVPVWILSSRLRPDRPTSRLKLPVRIALAASVAMFFIWLADDDATWRYSEMRPSLRNDFPNADATSALTLRYSKTAPGTLIATVPETKLVPPPLEPGSKNDAAWEKFLAENGREIETLWTDLAPIHAWIGELAGCPEIGDTADGFDSPIPQFQPLRLISQATSARALQLAAKGKHDEAVEILLPILTASRKLPIHARTLVRRMIAIVLQRNAQNTLSRILAAGEVSPATRTRIAFALAPTGDVEEQARLLAWCEYHSLCRMFLDHDYMQTVLSSPTNASGLMPPATITRLLVPVAMNPRLTANIHGDNMTAVGDAAAKRDFTAMKAFFHEFEQRNGSFRPSKNYAGRLLLAMATPSFEKVAESYWKADDERAALLASLTPAL